MRRLISGPRTLGQLTSTRDIEAIARDFRQELIASQPAAQYGVLLAATETGETLVLKGCSALRETRPEWVPAVSNQTRMRWLEASVLTRLDQLKAKLIELNQLPVRTAHHTLRQTYQTRLQQLKLSHGERKAARDRNRHHYRNTLQDNALNQALNSLNRASQQDKRELRQLKQERDQALAPLMEAITQADQQIQTLKKQYKALSQHWQTLIQSAYAAEVLGQEQSLELGDIAPYLGERLAVCNSAIAKLLHYAAQHDLKPLALAEFGCTHPQGTSQSITVYDAPPEECRVLMTLATLPPPQPPVDRTPPPILYQDDALIVVDKPAGLLSVPGRRYHLQDSVLSRLRLQLPDPNFLQVVHRLDQATSGILVLALSAAVHKTLSQQFAQHQVHKTYEAVLTRPLSIDTDIEPGLINLPLWGDPTERPKQSVNPDYGKPSVTHVQVLETGPCPRVKLTPQTGRTHQLRVHAAHPQGLNSPIKGDTLYGPGLAERLYLHATSLELSHPVTQKPLKFTSQAPF